MSRLVVDMSRLVVDVEVTRAGALPAVRVNFHEVVSVGRITPGDTSWAAETPLGVAESQRTVRLQASLLTQLNVELRVCGWGIT